MEFRVLGPVEVVDGRGAVALGGPQRRLLLAVLLSRPGRVCTASGLADALWQDDPPPAATTVLHAQVSRLRRVLEPDRAARAPARVLVSVEDGYRIEVSGHVLDATRFGQLVEAGRAALAGGDADAARSRLGEALALWRGPAFGELGGHPALVAAAAELAEQRIGASELRSEARLRLGEHAELVAELETQVREHPFRERMCAQLMLALYRCGRQADALATYQRCRRRLSGELGIEPGPELHALNEAILLQKPELAWRPPGSGAPSPVRHQRMTAVRALAGETPDAEQTVIEVLVAAGGLAAGEDAELAVFDSPGAAARAVADLTRRRWGVRVGVDTGPVIRLGDDWFGPAVTTATHLAGLAHRDQVLVSAATADQVAADLPPHTILRDIGMHRLPDRAGLHRLHELCGPDKFRPTRVGAVLIDVPEELSSFIGRRSELDRIVAELRHTRLLTLIGAGGTGKTRLGLRAARQALTDFPDGVVFVDLAPVDGPDALPEVLARSLRLHGDRDVALLDTIVDYLADREVLLVLDNCEHVTAPVATACTAILTGCPAVRMLATSRERLAVPGETSWPVPPLSLPSADTPGDVERSEAGRLFCDRAQSVAPGFALTEGNAADVAAICRRLDGLPLAVELAAARVRMLSPAQIADRLDNRFALLSTPSSTVRPRHRTLRTVVDWSYDLLGDPARRLLARLAVFGGGFSLEAAEAIGGPDTLGPLTELVDKSLVQVVAGHQARYRLLETIRAYATDRLSAVTDLERAARAAHAGFFLRLAERAAVEIRGPDDLDWLARLDADYDNLRAAIEWATAHDPDIALRLCGALGDYWFGRGRSADGWAATTAALSAASADSPARAGALYTASRMAYLDGHQEHAASLAAEALALARRHGDRRAEARALLLCGFAPLAGQGDLDETIGIADALLAMPADGEPWIGAWARLIAVDAYIEKGDDDAARRLVGDALIAARTAGNRLALGFALRVHAHVSWRADDHSAALAYLDEALRLAAAAGPGYTRQVILCLTDIARARQKQGELTAAHEAAQEAFRIATDIGSGAQAAVPLLVLCQLDRMMGDTEAARDRLAAARRSPDPAQVNSALLLLGEIELLDRRYTESCGPFEAAARVGPESARCVATIGRAAVGAGLGEPVARSELLAACQRLPSMIEWDAWYLAVAARLLADLDEPASVAALLDAALRDIGRADPLTMVRVAEQVAFLAGARDQRVAADLLAGATAVRQRLGTPRAPLETDWYAEAVAGLGVSTWDGVGAAGSSLGHTELLDLARTLVTAALPG